MIYADLFAENDTEKCPGVRPNQLCINCKSGWGSHHGWRCPSYKNDIITSFNELPSHARYVTPMMMESIINLYLCPRCKQSRCKSADCE